MDAAASDEISGWSNETNYGRASGNPQGSSDARCPVVRRVFLRSVLFRRSVSEEHGARIAERGEYGGRCAAHEPRSVASRIGGTRHSRVVTALLMWPSRARRCGLTGRQSASPTEFCSVFLPYPSESVVSSVSQPFFSVTWSSSDNGSTANPVPAQRTSTCSEGEKRVVVPTFFHRTFQPSEKSPV